MPVFSVYASFTSDIPKGIVVKPETKHSFYIMQAAGFLFFFAAKLFLLYMMFIILLH